MLTVYGSKAKYGGMDVNEVEKVKHGRSISCTMRQRADEPFESSAWRTPTHGNVTPIFTQPRPLILSGRPSWATISSNTCVTLRLARLVSARAI